jgi:DNA replication protein DnaC
MGRMQEAELLIIDEANIVQPTDDKRRIFEEILRWRGARELPTVLTCNVSQDEFTAMWGERTSVIVFQRAHWIKMGGERLRRVSSVVESF